MESKTNPKFSILKFIRNIILILLILYILTIIYKASIMNYISFKTRSIKDSTNYEYTRYSYDNLGNLTGMHCNTTPHYSNETTLNSGTLQEKILYNNLDNHISLTYSWYNSDPENKFTYSNSPDEEYANYEIGFSYENDSPYILLHEAIKDNYKLSFILNPLKTIKIDFKFNDFIFENNYKHLEYSNELYVKELIYVDMSSGLLSKKLEYHLDKLVFEDLYYDYKFNTLTDESVTIPEELKQEIIKKSDELDAQNTIEETPPV